MKYLENALCEYAHLHYDECLTSNPSKANCNEKFRREKYAPAYADYQKCEKYFKIIRYYLETLSYIPLLVKESDPAYPVLPVDTDEKTQGDKSNSSGSGDDINHNETYEFFFESKARGSKGIALISIHCGHSQKRKSILKAGSVLSVEVSPVTPGAEKIVALREKLKAAGKVVNRELKEDIAFDSQSGAIKFLNGTSLNGNNVWKTADGVPLAELL